MDMEVSTDDEGDGAPAAKKPRRQQQANDGSSAAQIQRVSAWNLHLTLPPSQLAESPCIHLSNLLLAVGVCRVPGTVPYLYWNIAVGLSDLSGASRAGLKISKVTDASAACAGVG